MRKIIAKLNHDFFFLEVNSHQRIAKPNLNHVLFFGKSNHAMRKIIAKPNHVFFLLESQIASWFGKRVFGKSNRAMWEIITKPNHVLCF
jgi:hypothetical protein